MIEHPHAGEDARRLAEAGTILRVQVGSGVHGTSVDGQDDRDEMGICLEPPAFVTGLARVRTPTGRWIPFEQYELHTAWERPGGLAERSGAGDLDVVVYGARKWAALAAAGNPTVLLPLWVPANEIVTVTDAGHELRANAGRFVSRLAADRFLGYLAAQRRGITGEEGGAKVRPAHRGPHGYDVKFAMHALRLGFQGIELLGAGRITLPVPEPALSQLRAVRTGGWTLAEVLDRLDDLQCELEQLTTAAHLPEEPDRAWIDGWLHRSYTAYWADLAVER